MPNIFNYFAKLSEEKIDLTIKSGRFINQKKAEKKIPSYLKFMMNLKKSDNIIEIGSGLGNLLIPLNKYVNKATALDHPKIIKNFKERIHHKKKINFISGNFLNIKISQKFDKVLVYGVLHCLKNFKEVEKFINKTLKITSKNGIIFFGDIPNNDLKIKFLNSKEGRKFQKKWEKNINQQKFKFRSFKNLVKFNNKNILKIIEKYNKKKNQVYLIPQPKDHPFSNTRVDLMIKKYG